MISDKNQRVSETWEECFQEIKKGEFLSSLINGGFTLEYYKGFLRETFHNASLNPKLGSLFHAHFHSHLPAMESRFAKHNASEIGHNELAIADLRLLGGNTSRVRSERPLPATEALGGFIAFQIQHRNPVAYLGYLFHLEAIATELGAAGMESLARLGVPEGAMSFLKEHAEIDTVHMDWNRQYIDAFTETDDDLESVLYGLRGTCMLHGAMLQAVVERANRKGDWNAGGTLAPAERPAQAAKEKA